jgi:TP901 family phage tail tape measure protein
MVRNVIELDESMTELRKVTDETGATYDSFLTKASERATVLGSKLTDLVNATADFARLGYSLSDATELAEVAVVYKNVGDQINNINDASEVLISILKAFNIEASKSMSVLDKLNEVGNKYAISSKGLGEALKRSSSSLAAAGNTLEQSIGLIVSANEIIQDPEIVGKHMCPAA